VPSFIGISEMKSAWWSYWGFALSQMIICNDPKIFGLYLINIFVLLERVEHLDFGLKGIG
jgi:hypothetical protein